MKKWRPWLIALGGLALTYQSCRSGLWDPIGARPQVFHLFGSLDPSHVTDAYDHTESAILGIAYFLRFQYQNDEDQEQILRSRHLTRADFKPRQELPGMDLGGRSRYWWRSASPASCADTGAGGTVLCIDFPRRVVYWFYPSNR